jgi:hypothetical protein
MITLTRDQVAQVHTLPECALHPGTLAVVDANTERGWGYLCLKCFATFGRGLGMGLGQVLVPVEPPHHIDLDSGRCHACGAGWVDNTLEHAKECLYNSAVNSFPELY